MLLSLFIIKLLVAVGVVILLSIVAERASPRVAGLLSGYPTGTAIALFFFGLEQSPQFAADSAVYNMIGLVAMQAFIYLYYKSSERIKKFSMVYSSVISITGYLAIIWLLHLIKPDKFIAVSISVASIFLFLRLFKGIENVKIRNRVKLSHRVLFIRAVFAASIILFITGIAKFVGPAWSGLFSAFPTTLYPLMLIIHFTYGKKRVHTIIKNVPVGLGSLVLYSLTLSIVYPLYGIYLGTAIGFVMATIYMLAYQFFRKRDLIVLK